MPYDTANKNAYFLSKYVQYTKLKNIFFRFQGTRNVTPAAVLSMAQALTSLKLLDVGYCEQVKMIYWFVSHGYHITRKRRIIKKFNEIILFCMHRTRKQLCFHLVGMFNF